MSILATPQGSIQITIDDQILKIKKANLMLKTQMEQLHTRVYNMVWKDKNFTPAEIIEAFGTDATALFVNSSQIQTILATVDPSYQPLTPEYDFTINQDGTVTLGNLTTTTTTT